MNFLFSFFYLYDPWLQHSFRMAFFIGLLSCVILGYQFYKKQVRPIQLPIDSFIAILGLLAVSVIPLLINQTKELGVLAMYSKLLILFSFGVVIFHLFYQKENGQALFVKDLNLGVYVQFAIGILCILGIPFLIEFALSTNSSVLFPRFQNSEQEYRLYNITSSAFIQLSTFYVLLLHFLLAYNKQHDNMSGFTLFALLCIGLISGRTFLILSVFSIALYFKVRFIPYLIAFGSLLLFLVFAFPENWYVEHALEPLINLIQGGKSVSSSTDTLMKQHLFMPEIKQLIMGDGYYYTAKGGYYGGSDSGFVRQVLYGGVAYLVICFVFTFYFVRKVARAWFDQSWIFTLSTLALFTIIHIKADTYAYPGIMFVLLTFLSLFDKQGKTITLFENKR